MANPHRLGVRTFESEAANAALSPLSRREFPPLGEEPLAADDDDFENGLDLVVRGLKGRAEILYRIKTELSKESDRGCGLVAAAFLENELSVLLKLFLVEHIKKELFDFNGPLGTFSAKIDMSYAMGLISTPIRDALHLVRKVRNDFAHLQDPLDFTANEIRQRVDAILPTAPFEASSTGKDLFIAKIQAIASAIHLAQANVSRRDPPVHQDVPARDTEAEHQLEIVARRLMEITAPEITYEQALQFARDIRNIK